MNTAKYAAITHKLMSGLQGSIYGVCIADDFYVGPT